MMRKSLQAVLPEISGNKTSLLRKSVCSDILTLFNSPHSAGNDSNLLIVFYVQIMPDDFVMQLHRF